MGEGNIEERIPLKQGLKLTGLLGNIRIERELKKGFH